MRKEVYQKVKIPQGVEVKINGSKVEVKGPQGHLTRDFNFSGIDFQVKGNELIIGHKKATKNEKKTINTTFAHLKNMLKGVEENYEYNLKVCYSHFPITVEMKGKEAIIKNFLGEKVPRKAKIPQGVEVKVDKEFITVSAADKELAGQAAANFEKATLIRKRDRRVFQDGIFITSKAGKEI